MSFALRPTAVCFAAATLCVVALIGAAPPANAAIDLTGTWEGTWSCKDVTLGAAQKPGGALTMTVTQSGDDVYAFIDWDGSGTASFQGHVGELTDKPGQGASTLIACSTRAGSDQYGETLSTKVKVNQDDPIKATLKGTSAYEGSAPFLSVGGTCKYSLKRTALADPGVVACPVVPEGGQLLKTGQTNCYDTAGAVIACAGTGQDGALQKGLARAYVDNGNGTITDTKTGLMWEKLDDNNIDPLHDKDTQYTWANAFATKVAALNGGGGFAGYTDWRLPNQFELYSLVNLGAVNPAVFPAFNTGCAPACTVLTCSCTQSDFYWSSSTYYTGAAWNMYFYDGLNSAAIKTFNYYVRAVRGGS